MITRLAHLCLRTSRFAEMTRFYRDGLGLPIHFSLKLSDGRVFGHYFALGGESFLELFDHAGATEMWGGSPTPPRRHEDATYQHFCLEVPDVAGERAAMRSRGIEVTEPTEGMDGSIQAWARDPDGNDIELMQYTARSLQKALPNA
ncbi:MAG TPA: VOC family protein [Treponemataceae bacterium]|nr:VOC family protein [Treponemataceae bacterium]